MKYDSFITRVRYKFDTFIAKGGVNIFASLFIVFVAVLVAIASLRGLLLLIMPEYAAEQKTDFFHNVFLVFLEMTDPGNMGIDTDSGISYKAVAIMAGVAGVIIFSALIAVITTALEGKIDDLKKGHTKVVESQHTLILGWNNRVIEIIRELTIANESEEDPCVTILADRPKEEMDDIIEMRLPDTLNTRLVTRSGNVSSLVNLEIVSLETAKSIIILAHCNDAALPEDRAASDTRVIKTVLGVMASLPEEDDTPVVAEVFDERNREIVETITDGKVTTFDTLDILAKILVQTSRSNGLSVVYSEVMSFDGCEMYFADGDWLDSRFGDMSFHFPDGVLMGIRRESGELLINPSVNTVVTANDDILILADDDSTIVHRPEPVATPRDLHPVAHRGETRIERELIIGWNTKTSILISEYNDYVKAGSQIDMLIHQSAEDNPAGQRHRAQAREELDAITPDLGNLTVEIKAADLLTSATYENLDLTAYDNILVLSQGGQGDDPEKIDSETIIILLMIRKLLKDIPAEESRPKLITEVMDTKNQGLVARAGVNDFIISNRLMSMLFAQISEEPDVLRVYDQIFDEDGSEIYLKSLKLYFNEFPVQATFADLMAVAQNREEICLGIKRASDENDPEKNYGVTLIPEKNTKCELTAEDHLVVLAEDEF